MKFEKRQIDLDLYGTSYKMHFPTFKETQDFHKASIDADEQRSMELMGDFLESLGLPKEASGSMEIDNLEQLIGQLVPKKK